jgi:hypothetical protein
VPKRKGGIAPQPPAIAAVSTIRTKPASEGETHGKEGARAWVGEGVGMSLPSESSDGADVDDDEPPPLF